MKKLNLNLDLKTAPKQAKKVIQKLDGYKLFIFILAVLAAYTFLVLQIGKASRAEPSQAAITEQMNTVQRLKIDQNSVNKIEQLEDQNVGVQALFKDARDNPFQDN
jgi:hypothetical protein